MTINFPISLDNFTNPTPANLLSTPAVLHSTQHANINDAVEALEAKVGINSSLVTSSLDYLCRDASGSRSGFVNTGLQSFAGDKIFLGDIYGTNIRGLPGVASDGFALNLIGGLGADGFLGGAVNILAGQPGGGIFDVYGSNVNITASNAYNGAGVSNVNGGNVIIRSGDSDTILGSGGQIYSVGGTVTAPAYSAGSNQVYGGACQGNGMYAGVAVLGGGSASNDGYGGGAFVYGGYAQGIGSGGVVFFQAGDSQFGTKGDYIFRKVGQSRNAYIDFQNLTDTDRRFRFPDQDGTIAVVTDRGTATLSGGTIQIDTTKITSTSFIVLSPGKGSVGNLGTYYESARAAGENFVINSSNASDNSTFDWYLI